MSHIILQYLEIENARYIRFVCTESSNDVATECDMVYGAGKWRRDLLKTYYNCSKWLERLMGDLSYKKYKTIKLEKAYEGMKRIVSTEQSSEIERWFSEDFEPFIRVKLTGYNEEDDEEINLVDMMKDITGYDINEHIEIAYDAKGYPCNFKLKKPEFNEDGDIVLSQSQLRAMLCFSVTYYNDISSSFITDVQNNLDTYKTKINRCPYTNNIYINYDGFMNINDIPYFLFKLRLTYDDIIQMKIHTYDIDRRFSMNNVTGYNILDSKLSFTYFGTSEEPEALPAYGAQIDWPGLIPIRDAKTSNKKEEPRLEYMYINNITGQIGKYSQKITLLTEVSFMICTNDIATNLGKIMLDSIFDIGAGEVPSIMKDIEIFSNILQKIHCRTTPQPLNCVSMGSTGDMQKNFTHHYVEKFKDENVDTMAADVIEKVYTFLNRLMNSKDINMNKIGQDLVDLGVKKTRKTKGNVYGIKNPFKNDVEAFAEEKKKQLDAGGRKTGKHVITPNEAWQCSLADYGMPNGSPLKTSEVYVI